MESLASLPKDRYGWLLYAAGVVLISSLAVWVLRDFSAPVLIGLALLPLALLITSHHKGLVAYALVLLSVLTFDQEEGTNLREALYYAFIAGCVGVLVPYLAATGRWRLRQAIDKCYLFFFLFILYGIALGFVTGAPMKNRIDDITLMFPLFTYFVLRDQMHDDKVVRNVMIVTVAVIIFISIRNMLNYQQILLNAVMEWQVQKARVAKNEVFLLLGSLAFFIIQSLQAKWVPRLVALGFFGFFMAGLILTQSRGYWLAFVLGATVFLLVADRKAKIRAIVTSAVLISAAVFVALTFYYQATMVVVENLAYRLSLTGGGLDPSLLERVHETGTVWELVKQNPLAGYGFGYTYVRYGLIAGYSTVTSYLHNGYLAMWYKMGFFGMLAAVSYLIAIVATGYRLYRKALDPMARTFGLVIMCQILSMMLVNITSPQFLGFDSTLLLAVLGAAAASLADRHLPSRTSVEKSVA